MGGKFTKKSQKNEINCIYNKSEETISLLYNYNKADSSLSNELNKIYNDAKNNLNSIIIYINDKKIEFNTRYTSDKKGKIKVKFIFNNIF